MHGNRDRDVMLFIPKRKMRTYLPILNEAMLPQESDQFPCLDLRHAAHSGTPTVNSSTWTIFSC